MRPLNQHTKLVRISINRCPMTVTDEPVDFEALVNIVGQKPDSTVTWTAPGRFGDLHRGEQLHPIEGMSITVKAPDA